MKVRYLLILLILLLAACGPASTDNAEPAADTVVEPAAVSDDVVESADEPYDAPTAVAAEPSEAEAASAADSEAANTTADQSETTTNSQPVEESPAAAVFPATTVAEASMIRDTDHFQGTEDPLLTIIEYGDFQ